MNAESIEQLPPELQEQIKKAMEGTTKTEPHDRKRIGSVWATIWKNTIAKDGKTFDTYNINIERRYKDKADVWQGTSNFHPNDMMAVQQLTLWAHERVRGEK